MQDGNKATITVEIGISAPVEKVWQFWTNPEHIKQWNNASDDWHTTHAENDLSVGGRFLSRMEAKDGSFGFDFSGSYNEIIFQKLISYTLDDNRKVSIIFIPTGNTTKIIETFEAENKHPIELQQTGWQSILNSFRKYTEAH